jgi:hypothetical protein
LTVAIKECAMRATAPWLALFLLGAGLPTASIAGREDSSRILVTLELSRTSYAADEPIICAVEIRNVGDQEVTLLNRFLFPNYYVRFDITDEEGRRVEYRGPIHEISPKAPWFVTLTPSNWIGQEIQIYSPTGPSKDQQGQYLLDRPGSYSITAVYTGCQTCREGAFGLPEENSNTVEFQIR